jgi:replicative DNA helicase
VNAPQANVIADVPSERAVLGCLLAWPEVGPAVWSVLTPADFVRPAHEALAHVLADWSGECNPQLVLAECQRRGLPEVVASLPDLLGRATASAAAVRHAEDVLHASRRRRIREVALAALQRVDSDDCDVAEVAGSLLTAAEQVILDAPAAPVTAPVSVSDFLIGEDTYDWIVPHLIERGDRLMVTGGEGSGKSVWLRQIAVCVAAGINPVSFTRIEPRRVLLADLENGRAQVRRGLRPLVALARRQGEFDPDMLRIIHRPSGVDVDDYRDEGWLAERVLAAKPDLLVIGPLYRLHSSPLDKEDAARRITVVLDRLRAKAGCALVIEAHAGHGFAGQRTWRPTGSSLFLRWPEFGLGLKPNFAEGTVAVKHWRGPRDERLWPYRMRRGGQGAWPWLEDSPDEREDAWTA